MSQSRLVLGIGDGLPDIIAGKGPGGGAHVRVFNGFTGRPNTFEVVP